LIDPLDAHLAAHAQRAKTLVVRRVADARTHAAGGAHQSATERLMELHDGLADALADARAAFYRRAFHHHRDPAIHRLDVGPSKEGEHVARTAPIAGRDQYRDLPVPFAEAILQLQTTAATVADPWIAPDLGAAMLDGWEVRHRQAIGQHIETALSDAQMTIHHAVGVALTREELR
jgi:hypothetical protein